MAKTQSKPAAAESEPWMGEDMVEIDTDTGSADAPTSAKARMLARQRIEDLLEKRRLQKQINDYDSFELDETIH